MQHTRILIFYYNLQHLATCNTPENGFSTVIYMNSKRRHKENQREMGRTKGKLKGADGKQFNTKGKQRKIKEDKSKTREHRANICSLPVKGGVNGTLSAQSPVPPPREVTPLGDLQEPRILIFYCNPLHLATYSTPEY